MYKGPTETQAYNEGVKAYNEGKGLLACPYCERTEKKLVKAWDRGYFNTRDQVDALARAMK
jgi:hypothetical protein